MKYKRGATLIELVIVMVLVAVIGVMVLTFTGTVHGWANLGTDRVNLVQEENAMETIFESFLANYDAENFAISVEKIDVAVSGSAEPLKVDAIVIRDTGQSNKLAGAFYYLKDAGVYVIDYQKTGVTYSVKASEGSAVYSGSGSAESMDFIEDISFNVESSVAYGEDGTTVLGTKRMAVCRIFYHLNRTIGKSNKTSGSYIINYTLRSLQK